MTEASIRSQLREDLIISEDENSSEISIQNSTSTRGISGMEENGCKQKPEKPKQKGTASATPKAKPTPRPRTTVRFEDLTALEHRITAQVSTQVDTAFSSLHGRMDQMLALLNYDKDSHGSVQRRPDLTVGNDTSGVREPRNNRSDTSGVHRTQLSLDNDDYEQGSHPRDDDTVSLQPGQRERQSLGLSDDERDSFSSSRSPSHEPEQFEQVTGKTRFDKYSADLQSSTDKEGDENKHDKLYHMFGEDAQTKSSQSKKGLCLDKAQTDILKNSWRCQNPDKLSAYQESSKQSFPVSEKAENDLKVPSLDELTERLLIRRHGRKAAFGNTQSLYSKPHPSFEKVAYQGQVAARLGIVSVCYTQQALGLLLTNLQSKSPNLDEAVQNVRDIFAMTTKSLDQVARAGAFHHVIRRRATIEDTGLYQFKDLQKTAMKAPLSGEGVFGSEFEKKLKDRQEKDKQLSDLMPEFKRPNKRKNNDSAESNTQKRPRQSDDSQKSKSTDYHSKFQKSSRGGNFNSSGNRNNFSKNNSSVSSFRFPGGNKSNRS